MGDSSVLARDLRLDVSKAQQGIMVMVADESVALVVLYSDSMNAVFPRFSSDQWKLMGLAV